MLSALLCALAAASGYGPSATPRATAPSPGVLVDGFQPRITNVVHGTPRMTASWQCSTRLFPKPLDSQGSDPSIGVCYTPGHFLTRIEAASGRCDPPAPAASAIPASTPALAQAASKNIQHATLALRPDTKGAPLMLSKRQQRLGEGRGRCRSKGLVALGMDMAKSPCQRASAHAPV